MKSTAHRLHSRNKDDRSLAPGRRGLKRAAVALRRRTFMKAVLLGASASAVGSAVGCGPNEQQPPTSGVAPKGVVISDVRPGEDIFAYVTRVKGAFDQTLYRQVVGAANEYKEGDEAQGVAASNEASRKNARLLLQNTKIGDLVDRPLFVDAVYDIMLTAVDKGALDGVRGWTMGALKTFLLEKPEAEIKAIMKGLTSDIIAMSVKLMSNAELTSVGSKIFNPLPGTNIGAKGYLGARVQPNSPTDNTDDIIWQVFNGFSFAVGDVVLGNNPVSSEIASVHAIEEALRDVLETFGVQDLMPHCVLSHIDVQAEVEKQFPGSTALWFQSLGGTAGANGTFDVTVQKMLDHAAKRTGKYGMYFETGQGADATNGHGEGFDMVVHESRIYGFARALTGKVAEAQLAGGSKASPWVHLNDVAGFIGPEIFRSREQLVRCCLEDIVMGKLHGLMIGLDVCSTLHMDVTLDDLDWCLDQIMPANPGYLMGLPTKNDPMLSYLTTAFQDHVRIREKFGYKVNDAMWDFYKKLEVIDAEGKPTKHFGDPRWVYLQYRKLKADPRPDTEILEEAATKVKQLYDRGVWIAEGYESKPWEMNKKLSDEIRFIYNDSKKSIWAELPLDFSSTVANAVPVWTGSMNREDYILHPPTGERIHDDALPKLNELRASHAGKYNVQIMVSDGLNAYAITDMGHLEPYLKTVRAELEAAGYKVAPEHIVCVMGRVRAGYHAGEVLFGDIAEPKSQRAILHIIGERPGTKHHAFSVYFTSPTVETWSQEGVVDHNITKVISNIAATAGTHPADAAKQTVSILKQMFPPG